MSDLATISFDGVVATLTLRRPEARNALSIELLRALHTRADELAADAQGATVLVVTGEGKSFCAGMDLKGVLADAAAPGVLLRSLADFTLKLRRLPLVSVAKVSGAAIGGGCGLACVCDVAVTHAESVMGYPEVDLGVCPAVVAPWLVRKIGPGRARRVLLMGGTMSGAAAHELGMVDALAPTAADLDRVCGEIVTRLAGGGPQALRATKALLNEIDGSLDEDVLRRGAELSAKVVALPETQAALRARMK